MLLIRILRSFIISLIVLSGAAAFAGKVALVVIDMQPYFSDGATSWLPQNKELARTVLMRQAELILTAQEHQVPIIKIEYKGYGDTHGFLNEVLGDYPLTRTFLKESNGMFDIYRGSVSTELHNYLQGLGITDLVITGANGGYCVRCSIEGALRHDYRVWADNMAIIDFNTFPYSHPYRYKEGFLRVDTTLLQNNFFQTENIVTIESILQGQLPLPKRPAFAPENLLPPNYRTSGLPQISSALSCKDVYLTPLYLIGH